MEPLHPPEAVHPDALVELQVNVAVPFTATLMFEDAMLTVGGGPLGPPPPPPQAASASESQPTHAARAQCTPAIPVMG